MINCVGLLGEDTGTVHKILQGSNIYRNSGFSFTNFLSFKIFLAPSTLLISYLVNYIICRGGGGVNNLKHILPQSKIKFGAFHTWSSVQNRGKWVNMCSKVLICSRNLVTAAAAWVTSISQCYKQHYYRMNSRFLLETIYLEQDHAFVSFKLL